MGRQYPRFLQRALQSDVDTRPFWCGDKERVPAWKIILLSWRYDAGIKTVHFLKKFSVIWVVSFGSGYFFLLKIPLSFFFIQTGVMSRNCILKLIDSRSNQNLADGRTSVRYMRRRTYRKVKEKEGGELDARSKVRSWPGFDGRLLN